MRQPAGGRGGHGAEGCRDSHQGEERGEMPSTSFCPSPVGIQWQESLENVTLRAQHPPTQHTDMRAHALQSSAAEGQGADLRATRKRPAPSVR